MGSPAFKGHIVAENSSHNKAIGRLARGYLSAKHTADADSQIRIGIRCAFCLDRC